MSRTLTAADRSALIRRASTMPAGSPERKAILAGLQKQARPVNNSMMNKAHSLLERGTKQLRTDDDEGGFEVEEVDTTRRLSASRVASWMKAKRFFPGVRNPVFHATTGPRAASIALLGEGIRSNSGMSNFGAGNVGSISLSRDLSFLLKGGFGKVIFVLDRDELSRKFPVNPLAYPNWEDEYEERVFTNKIPASMIRGVIFRYKPLGFELDEWESMVDYPLVYIEGREWGARA